MPDCLRIGDLCLGKGLPPPQGIAMLPAFPQSLLLELGLGRWYVLDGVVIAARLSMAWRETTQTVFASELKMWKVGTLESYPGERLAPPSLPRVPGFEDSFILWVSARLLEEMTPLASRFLLQYPCSQRYTYIYTYTHMSVELHICACI